MAARAACVVFAGLHPNGKRTGKYIADHRSIYYCLSPRNSYILTIYFMFTIRSYQNTHTQPNRTPLIPPRPAHKIRLQPTVYPGRTVLAPLRASVFRVRRKRSIGSTPVASPLSRGPSGRWDMVVPGRDGPGPKEQVSGVGPQPALLCSDLCHTG